MEVSEVNKLIKQHAQMAKMMKKFANPSGMAKMMKSLSGLQKQFGGGGGMGPLFGGNDKNNCFIRKARIAPFIVCIFFISSLNKTTFAYPNFQKNQADSKKFEIK